MGNSSQFVSPAPSLGALGGSSNPQQKASPSPLSLLKNGNGQTKPKQKNYAHKKLHARHHRMAELVSIGCNNKQIAQELGMTQSAVSLNVNSPLMQQLVAKMRDERLSRIKDQAVEVTDLNDFQELTPQAVELYKRYIDSDNDELAPKDKARLAGDIMDRGGIPKRSESHVSQTRFTITAEELQGIEDRTKESPKFIDAEVKNAPAEE